MFVEIPQIIKGTRACASMMIHKLVPLATYAATVRISSQVPSDLCVPISFGLSLPPLPFSFFLCCYPSCFHSLTLSRILFSLVFFLFLPVRFLFFFSSFSLFFFLSHFLFLSSFVVLLSFLLFRLCLIPCFS